VGHAAEALALKRRFKEAAHVQCQVHLSNLHYRFYTSILSICHWFNVFQIKPDVLVIKLSSNISTTHVVGSVMSYFFQKE
jgi:hypothetical protein